MASVSGKCNESLQQSKVPGSSQGRRQHSKDLGICMAVGMRDNSRKQLSFAWTILAGVLVIQCFWLHVDFASNITFCCHMCPL